MLMLHFVSRLPFSWHSDASESPARLVRSWPWVSVGALLLPYLLFLSFGAFGDALAPAKLWDALWPILVGGFLAVWLARVADRLPRIPTGDTIVIGEAAFDSALASGAHFDRVDPVFHRWPAAGLALLAIPLVLVFATAYAG
jgi:hypothetical protein